MDTKARAAGFVGLIVLFALIATPLARREKPDAAAPIDPWTHVLGRIVRGGPSNVEGPYASSYTRLFKTRAGEEKAMLLVDSPRRELDLAQALLKAGFIREGAFHLRNLLAFHPEAPETAGAGQLLESCGKRSALQRIAPLSLVLTDGKRLLTSVPRADAGLDARDFAAIAEGRLEETARRHAGTGTAFALFYDAARAAKGDEAGRLYREALALAHVPSLPLVRPADEAHRAVGFIDDTYSVNSTTLEEPVAIFFPDSDFETAAALLTNRAYYEVAPGPLYDTERNYKTQFLVNAAAALGETPEIERARVYWGAVPHDKYSTPEGPLDAAYERAAKAAPHLQIIIPTTFTRGPELPVKLDWSNLDKIRFRFSAVTDLPRTETELKKRLETLRDANLPVAYEHSISPAGDVNLPIREPGTWRVTAEGGGLSCSFFAVRCDPNLEALVFPAETVLLTDLPGLSVVADSAPATEKDGAIRIGPWLGKYCAAHVECCKGCDSCAHHHEGGRFVPGEAMSLFACDGRSFFHARATPDPAVLPQARNETFGPALYVYADRPVYRAGNTMRFRGLLRVPKESFGRDGRYDAVSNAHVTVSILRDKDTLFKRDYVTGDFGTFAGEFTLPLTTARAEYALKVDFEPHGSASASFEVIDYRKSDYVITLESRKGEVAIRAGYAWGAPVPGTRVKAFVNDKEADIRDGRVAASPGDRVRAVLLRGDQELASKTHIHRETAAPAEPSASEAETAAPVSGSRAAAGPTVEAVPPIRTAKKVYGRGETIEVDLTGPDGEALVVLGDAVAYDWQRVPVREGRGVARFPTTATHDPGTTIFAVLGGRVERLQIEINAQRMRVDIRPDAGTARPGEDVGVTIRALPGAELSLAAVDEAVFMIREDQSPDLYGTFYPTRTAGMAHIVFDSFTWEGDSRLVERLPQDPCIRPVVRSRDCISREFVHDRIGVGGGGGGGGRYGGRFGGRETLVARGGGTRATESTVLTNLKGLAEHQRPDGSWGPGDTRTEFGTINAIGRTALVLLSYLGAGYSHLSKDTYNGISFGDLVKSGLTSLLRMQGADGCIGPASGDYLVNHALATLALSEAYGMSATQAFKSPAQNALTFMATRQASDGGWHPAGGSQGEAGATALAVFAMKSGQLSELDYGTVAAMNATRFFRTLTRADGSCPVSRAPGAAVTPFSTACAMISFMYLDADKKEPRLCGVSHLVKDLPNGDRPDFATWYMVSQALFQYDGPDGTYWKKWNEPMKNAIVPMQAKNGMWAVESPLPDSICTTGLAGLTLETYYRYANVFGAKGGGGGSEPEPRPLAPKPAIRVHFPDTALWIPDLLTDERGEAKAILRMPDSITTLRLTSRGITKDTAVGEGIARIESRQPFFINLKAPAFFVAGDESEIRADVFNYTGATVETECALDGDGFSVIGPASRKVKVAEACESVSWRVRIDDVERVRFRISSDRDAVEKSIAVRPRTAPASRSFRGSVVMIPPGEKPVDLVVRVSPNGSPLSKVLDALRFLNEYPHG